MSLDTSTVRPAERANAFEPAPSASLPTTLGVAALTLVLILLGLFAADRTVGAGMDGMSMTHYMGLLAVNQPWNLLIFMGLPVLLAETLAITELVVLFAASPAPWVRSLNRVAGLLAGPVMIGITVHLLRYAVVPLTTGSGWRGVADVIAVLAYLAGTIPMVGLTLVELGILGQGGRHAMKLHVTFVGVFLVLAHVAMIFGMMDPTVMGWSDAPALPSHQMPDGSIMPGMNH